jgi:hypothetical protein
MALAERTRVRMLGAAVVVLLVAGGIAVAVHDDESIAPGAARADVNGEALVVRGDTGEPLTDGTVLVPGDEVVVGSGTVVLELANGTTLEGRAGRGDTAATRVIVDRVPQLLEGDLLVIGDGVSVDAGTVDVELATSADPAAVRINRSLSVTTASYDGGVAIDSAGQRRDVPELRQLTVASLGQPPRTAEPLRYDESDPWDLRFLGAAIEVGRRLEALSRAYTPPPGEAVTAGFFAIVLPGLDDEPDFVDGDLLDVARAPGETLVGAAIALLGDRGAFAERWAAVFGLRDEAAQWGLVAADQGVTDDPVVDEVELALGRTADLAAEQAAGPVGGGGVGTGAGTTTAPSGTTPTSGMGPIPPPTTAPPVLAPPSTEPEVVPETGVPLLDSVAQPVENLLGGLLGRG